MGLATARLPLTLMPATKRSRLIMTPPPPATPPSPPFAPFPRAPLTLTGEGGGYPPRDLPVLVVAAHDDLLNNLIRKRGAEPEDTKNTIHIPSCIDMGMGMGKGWIEMALGMG